MMWQSKGGGQPKKPKKKARKNNHLRLVDDENDGDKPKFFH